MVEKSSSLRTYIVCYIVEILGPYLANQNDHEILKSVIEDPSDLRKFLKEGDVFVLVRDFQDIKKKLEEDNFNVPMPALKGKRKQLSTKESNESRFVTKSRWQKNLCTAYSNKNITFWIIDSDND